MKLGVIYLNGTPCVRPLHALGTCGWHPKAWTLTYVGRDETATEAFLRGNPNWTREELTKSYEEA